MSHKLDGQLFVQSQGEPNAIELFLRDKSASSNLRSKILGCIWFVIHNKSPVENTEIEIKFGISLKIKSSELFVPIEQGVNIYPN
jgi:hypothetical protein